MTDRERLRRTLGHEFNDVELLDRALTHRSAGARNNERLEFLGDSVLQLVVSESLYERFPDAGEGQLTRTRAAIVKEPTLAAVAPRVVPRRTPDARRRRAQVRGFDRDSIPADALEAVIGAICVDAGLEAARSFVHSRFGSLLDSADPMKARKDPKTMLQERLQGRGLELPEYVVQTIEGAGHDQRFVVHCQVPGAGEVFEGTGTSKRRAEQAAAARALEALYGTSDVRT
ncbi:MAG: ribonuclease III [Gammaproteobacteria bacterium]|nr:ribonuclease III [Gammaproteobacteria bacterium]